MSSDLFAGLSINPSVSPTKTEPTPAAAAAAANGYAAPSIPSLGGGPAAAVSPQVVSEGSAGSSNVSAPPPAAPAPAPAPRITSAPATDRLLGMLGTPPASPAVSRPPVSAPGAPTTTSSPGPALKSASPAPAAANRYVNNAATEEVLTAFSMDSQGTAPGSKSIRSPSATPTSASPSRKGSSAAPTSPATATPRPKPSLRGVGTVTTPVPNPSVAMRLFRKFAQKTRPNIPESHGGTQKRGILGYLFGSTSVHDRKFDAYKSLMESVLSDDNTESAEHDNDAAKKSIARFAHLLGVWGHASAHMAEVESKSSSSYQAFCDVLSLALDTATALVTHGCLDGVLIEQAEAPGQTKGAVNVLAEGVFASDLSQERVELAAMKFLLSTGCRVYASADEGQQAMLRGTHLLQTIRVLYHVFLTTASHANKTTARASLQQLVTSVFIRMIASSTHSAEDESKANDEDDDDEKMDDFPTENHRDAFLVLRSLCKLSMRNPPSHMHSHIGLQAGNSNTTWDAQNNTSTPRSPDGPSGGSSSIHGGPSSVKTEHPSLIYTQAIHPALESKILALELLLYVLQNTDMKGDFIQHSGAQFHYAIRNYLCVSLLKNCTSDNTRVVNLSLRVFVPIIRNFRAILKAEIEAFVTNVFFVILDSRNSPMDHKNLVVTLFEEICSDPQTLAEIFLNYDCDLSAVDLFHRIVNTLAKVARSMDLEERDNTTSTISLVAGVGAARMEKVRSAHRELRLEAMRALRQVLASLHGSIVKPMDFASMTQESGETKESEDMLPAKEEPSKSSSQTNGSDATGSSESKQSLVQIYGSKKKRREEEAEVTLRFNQKPSAGLAYASKCGHVDGTDPMDVARYLLANKDKFEKTQIGEFLGREPEYQNGFAVKVLHGYVNSMDFAGLVFDDAIRYYLSGFRLPGEAQKIDRIMEKFAERFTAQNPDVFPTADVAFILAFSIIMLNTDLHNPAIKEERRMTKDGFIRNNRGICDGQDLPQEFLMDIFDRIKKNPISLKEDDEARERFGEVPTSLPSAISPAAFFTSPYEEADRTKETNFNKERDQIVRTTESLLRRRRVSTPVDGGKTTRRQRSNSQASRHHTIKYVRTDDSGLRDEYVSPMFEVTWGPALAAFSTAMESANGTVGALLSIATDEELEAAAMNAAETIEVCLTGFRFAICTAGLCGNDVARDAFMLALTRFSQLGTGILLEPRHVRCIQTILALARADGELLGSSWEHVFKALSEINRFHQLFQLLARNDKAIAVAAERRRARLLERERRIREKLERRAAKENTDSLDDSSFVSLGGSDGDLSFSDSDLFSDSDFDFRDDMTKKEIDEFNARTVYEAVSETLIEAIYERSSSLSTTAVKEFVLQLCRVSRMEISHYGGQVGSDANQVDLTQVQYRQHHSLLGDSEGFQHHQPNIYNLQKLVEVTHYNMDSRPRLVFADIWTLVSAHLTSTALHNNPAVAMYAVDSFRQLSIQYLQREELGVFEFQRRFLKPLETVMARSEVHTTKELLLKCVERLILMFGSPSDEQGKRGMLRSGWRPVLTVLGLAGRDKDKEIAKLGFGMLSAQLEPILAHKDKGKNGDQVKALPSVLLDERFVDLVDALLIYVEGPHEEMSLKCLDHLLILSSFLADESFALPLIKKRGVPKSPSPSFEEGDGEAMDGQGNEELELWWPVLLGISRAIGDERQKVRTKSLETLSKIITTYFFPTAASANDQGKKERQIQLLQLIFRGILTPVLEFAEEDVADAKPPHLPDDFDRFLTGSKAGEGKVAPKTQPYWLDTTFEMFMDTCVSICIRSGEAFGEDTLLDEVLAMLNNCLLSDSGALAVRGLRRLEQLLAGDMKANRISDDTWATVSHMLRRCLTVRSLPKAPSTAALSSSASGKAEEGSTDEGSNPELEHKEAIREFVTEDNMLPNRRFIPSNAVMVIGSFLGGERFARSLGLRWRVFLVAGLGKAIRDWEYAAAIIVQNGPKAKARTVNPPSYLENAVYGRKYMNRFLLQIASMKEVAEPATEGSRQASAQVLIKEQTQSLISTFLEKEAIVADEGGKPSALDVRLFERFTGLVKDMLAGYDKLPDEHLALMPWLNPVLSSCIHTGNESIRIAIQKLLKRLHEENTAV